jgi:hypothetical protein
MDKTGFRAHLESRNLPKDEITASLALAEKFESYLQASSEAKPTPKSIRSFSQQLIAEGANQLPNFYALARYCYFIGESDAYIAVVDILDGAEAIENLYHKADDILESTRRDALFEGIPLPQLGLPNKQKIGITRELIPRLEVIASPEECEQILGDSLRYLPDFYYEKDKKLFEECGSVDAYLDRNEQDFIAELETLRDEGKPFFTQFITDEVIDYVRNEPFIARGLREGNIVYEVKIPHQTIEFLAESDPQKKRYYYCHCPWVKESLKGGPSDIPATFCTCSAGFHKKRWEIIFGQKLKAEIIESVLKGDDWCKIAIHLPEEVV